MLLTSHLSSAKSKKRRFVQLKLVQSGISKIIPIKNVRCYVPAELLPGVVQQRPREKQNKVVPVGRCKTRKCGRQNQTFPSWIFLLSTGTELNFAA